MLDTALSNPLKYVLYFKDIENNILYAKPHYYIILPTKTNEFIFLTMITSQIDKVKSRVENKETKLIDVRYNYNSSNKASRYPNFLDIGDSNLYRLFN